MVGMNIIFWGALLLSLRLTCKYINAYPCDCLVSVGTVLHVFHPLHPGLPHALRGCCGIHNAWAVLLLLVLWRCGDWIPGLCGGVPLPIPEVPRPMPGPAALWVVPRHPTGSRRSLQLGYLHLLPHHRHHAHPQAASLRTCKRKGCATNVLLCVCVCVCVCVLVWENRCLLEVCSSPFL